MNLRIPKRAESQWLRCKAALREQLAPAGQAIGDSEIHSAAVALLEACLRVGPGIIADDDPADETVAPIPFTTPDLSGRSSEDHIARASERRRHADFVRRMDALGEKIDALTDALVGSNK